MQCNAMFLLTPYKESNERKGIKEHQQNCCCTTTYDRETTTFRNISRGASKMSSTSALFKTGLNKALSETMPITGTTLRPFCKRKVVA
jgi:hypothetical protein